MQGVEVSISDCIGGHRCLQQLLDARAEIATAGDLPVVFNSFTRNDFVVLATMVTTTEDVKLIADKRSGVSHVQQLKGKRVGVVVGSASQYFLELYLLAAGIDPRGLALVSMQPEEMPDALQSGRVDAIATWEPYGYRASKALANQALVLPKSLVYTQTFNLVANRRMVGSKDVELTQVMKAIAQAEQFIQDQPEAAQAILKNRLKVDQGFVDWVWSGFRYRLALDQSLIKTMEGEARWAMREGHVKGKAVPNFFELIHSAPLKAAKEHSVGVRP